MVYANSTNVVSALSYVPALSIDTATIATAAIAAGTATFSTATITTATINGGTITGITDLAVADGGTGLSTLTANNVILGNGASAPTFVAPSTSGNVLTSNGSAWISSPGFTSGMIILWSGSIVSVPSGWFLCDGANSTPDLRNRFVVGAGSTYAVNATGGSADAITVSHNHSITDPSHTHTYAGRNPATNIAYAGTGGDPYFALTNNLTTVAAATGISVNTAGSSGTNANLPPYLALAYIMKS
jgi:microcystin-dependent protein